MVDPQIFMEIAEIHREYTLRKNKIRFKKGHRFAPFIIFRMEKRENSQN